MRKKTKKNASGSSSKNTKDFETSAKTKKETKISRPGYNIIKSPINYIPNSEAIVDIEYKRPGVTKTIAPERVSSLSIYQFSELVHWFKLPDTDQARGSIILESYNEFSTLTEEQIEDKIYRALTTSTKFLTPETNYMYTIIASGLALEYISSKRAITEAGIVREINILKAAINSEQNDGVKRSDESEFDIDLEYEQLDIGEVIVEDIDTEETVVQTFTSQGKKRDLGLELGDPIDNYIPSHYIDRAETE